MRASVTPKGVVGIVFLVIAIVVGVIVAYTSGIAHGRSATRIGYIGNSGSDNWSGTYELLDGKMRKTLSFGSSENIEITSKTESGILSIEIHDTEGNLLFSRSDIGTSSHNVSVDGNVVITLSTDKHKGSFLIR